MSEIKAEGNGIYLRLMTEADTDRIVKWRNDPRVRCRFIYQELFTPEGHLNWIHTMIDTGKAVQFIICEKETDRPIGSVYFRDISPQHHKAEYGIFIGEADAEGKGYGTETCRLACDYAFATYGWHRIFLRAIADNGRAIRSYEKAGFVREALLKDDVCLNGEFKDVVLMGRINPADKK